MEELTAYRTERDVDRPTRSAVSSATLVLTPVVPAAPERSHGAEIAHDLSLESRRRERRLRRALALVDVLAFATALLVSVTLASPDTLNPAGLLLLPALVAAAKLFGLYDSDDQRIRKTTADELPRLAQLGTLVVLAMWLGDRLLIGGPAGKTQAIAVGLIFVAVASVGRRTARRAANRRADRERCLLLGDSSSYQRLATIFDRHQLPSDLVGFTPLEQVLDAVRAAPGHEIAVLRELIAAERAHRINIGPHAMSNAATFEILEAARGAGARVSLLPDMLEVVGSSVDFDDLYGVTLLGVRHADLSRSSQLLKRAFDVVGAALVLAVTAPVMAVIAIAVRLDSRGPVLFCQPRVGRAGEPFRIFKFRTMVDGAERLKEELRELNEAEGLFRGAVQDPRRPAHHACRTVATALISRRATADLQRAAGADEPRRPAPAGGR